MVLTAPAPADTSSANPIEAWLDGHGLTYKAARIKLSEIDKDASLRNQARVGAPLNDDQVLMYGASLERGDIFPPIVVWQQPKTKKYVVIDGNHRYAANDLVGNTDINAYIVDSPSEAQTIVLTFEANTKHGLPTSMEERLRQAIVLVEHGATQTSAAQRLGVPLKRVEDAIRIRKGDRRADTLGINKRWHGLPMSARKHLGMIRNDNVFKAAAELWIVTGMNSADSGRLVPRINAAGTEAAALKLIEQTYKERKDEIKVTAGNRLGLSPRLAQYNAAVRKISHVEVADFTKNEMGSDLKARLRVNTVAAINKLAEFAEILK